MTNSAGDLLCERARAEGDESGSGLERIAGRWRVHCSYHKCLTVYFGKVMKRMARTPFGLAGDYRHFEIRE